MPLQGAQRFPTHSALVHQTAGLCANAGLTKVAVALAHGLKYAADATTRRQFEQLRAALPPAAQN